MSVGDGTEWTLELASTRMVGSPARTPTEPSCPASPTQPTNPEEAP
jgi:hypothetical protein